jgi:hypothetical protein
MKSTARIAAKLLMGEDEAVTTRRFAKHCEAQDVPDTLVLRCLAKTHR